MFVNGKTLLKAAPIKDMIPTKERFAGTSYGLSEAGYDVRIKQKVQYIHSVYGDRVVLTDPYTEEETIFPGNCVLASTMEEFQMPDILAAEVKDKSTHARNFLSIFNTAIEPGWNGFLTLELVFHGRKNYTIAAGQGIAQIRFTLLSDRSEYGDGKYQNAADKPQEALA